MSQRPTTTSAANIVRVGPCKLPFSAAVLCRSDFLVAAQIGCAKGSVYRRAIISLDLPGTSSQMNSVVML